MKNETGFPERRIRRLIAFGVILFAVVMNLDRVGAALSWLLDLLSPILMGLIFALILYVPMHGFERILSRIDRRDRMPRKVESALSLLLTAIAVPLVLFVLMRFIIPQFVSAITNVIAIVEANQSTIAGFVSKIGLEPAFVSEKLAELGAWIKANITQIAGTTVNTAINIFGSVTDVVLAIILSIYILADKAALARRARSAVRALLPERAGSYLCRCGSMFISTFSTFISRQCLEAVILGLLILVCMLIFRVPYAVTICCMTALLALIPYVGAFLSLLIGCVLIITISPMKTLVFAIIFLVAQQVEGNLIYPHVVGKSVGLPAYITLGAVMLGGALAGILGMFFIIPVVSLVYVLLREFVQRRNAEKDAQLRAEDA